MTHGDNRVMKASPYLPVVGRRFNLDLIFTAGIPKVFSKSYGNMWPNYIFQGWRIFGIYSFGHVNSGTVNLVRDAKEYYPTSWFAEAEPL